MIKDNNFLCDFDVNFYISEKTNINRELLEDAVNNSRIKAEVLANAVGKKIVGVDEINNLSYGHRNYAKSITIDDVLPEFLTENSLIDELTLPEKEKSEEVEVVWLLE